MGSNYQRNEIDRDVKHKISKLKADSRQLCQNLRNLHKNRAKLTNEAVALSQQLESPTLKNDFTEETLYSDPNCIHVLLDAKHDQERNNDCCTICTCSECEDYPEVAGDILGRDAEEESKQQKCCCICYTNNNENFRRSDKSATIVDSGVGNDLNSTGSQDKLTFCSACSVEGKSCNNRCEICDCEIENHKKILSNSFRTETKTEVRCRGGMDYANHKFRQRNPCENERDNRMCEGCECNLCAIRNIEGQQPPCIMCNSFGTLNYGNDENTNDEIFISSGDAPAKLQEICKVEKLREVLEQLKNRNHALRKMLNDCECLNQSNINSLAFETGNNLENQSDFLEIDTSIQTGSTSDLIATVKILQTKCRTKDGMILALAEALKKLASPDQTDRILKKLSNPCTNDSPIQDLDRSSLWQFLRMENPQNQQNEKNLEGEEQDENEESESEESSKCRCATYTQVLPPRNLRIVERIGTDTLVISWEPPNSGPINGYKIFVDEQLAQHLKTPLKKTEAVLHNLDLTIPRLIEILTIGSSGFGSSTIEKLYDPIRFDRSKGR